MNRRKDSRLAVLVAGSGSQCRVVRRHTADRCKGIDEVEEVAEASTPGTGGCRVGMVSLETIWVVAASLARRASAWAVVRVDLGMDGVVLVRSNSVLVGFGIELVELDVGDCGSMWSATLVAKMGDVESSLVVVVGSHPLVRNAAGRPILLP